MALHSVIAVALEHLTVTDWLHLRDAAGTDRRWHAREWWHNKYYRDNPPNDGFAVQRRPKGEPEIPYERQLFYPSECSRFSLGSEGPIAYFSNDFATNCCETIEQFALDESLFFHDLSLYLRGYGNPTPGQYGYPMNFHLIPNALVLDVSTPGASFFRLLGKRAEPVIATSIFDAITSREPADKRATRRISIGARHFGFDGLVYQSVRVPVDVILPDQNLVVFTPEAVSPGLPPNKALHPTPSSWPD